MKFKKMVNSKNYCIFTFLINIYSINGNRAEWSYKYIWFLTKLRKNFLKKEIEN